VALTSGNGFVMSAGHTMNGLGYPLLAIEPLCLSHLGITSKFFHFCLLEHLVVLVPSKM
jgi:hypothetical protein